MERHSRPDSPPIALITGITGQDGSYLTEQLLNSGYTVHGLVRRTSNTVRTRLESLIQNPEIYEKQLYLHYADLDDTTTIRRVLLKTKPAEFYHLAGQSHVGASFEVPESTCQFVAMGTLRILEILRDLDNPPKFLHISSSEIFGRPDHSPQNESTSFRPVTPYGVAKAFATEMVRVYRESFGLFACNAICYNHESPRRGESFVTRKITRGAARIRAGLQETLKLGNLEASRDWGHARDYVDGMWRMLQHSSPTDFLLATGKTHTVKEFLRYSFDAVNLSWENHVRTDPRHLRLAEVEPLRGDSSLALSKLGWSAITTCQELAEEMVQHDLEILQKAGSSVSH